MDKSDNTIIKKFKQRSASYSYGFPPRSKPIDIPKRTKDGNIIKRNIVIEKERIRINRESTKSA